jgi:hypothetical protein
MVQHRLESLDALHRSSATAKQSKNGDQTGEMRAMPLD